MAAGYLTLTTARATPPDPVALEAAVKTATGDATAVLRWDGTVYRGKKATPWSAGDIAAAQNALDTVAADSAQKAAQRAIDSFPIEYKALVLTLIDALNTLRAFHGLAAITPAQAIASIRNKAATL